MTVLDALTYAGHIENLGEAFLSPKFTFVSHVDRSFFAAGAFLKTNVLGTQTLAEAAMRHGISKFVHVSTDEVYGPLPEGSATEADPLHPTVPYAASKAASDLVALSYFHTYGVPVCVTRSSNNYGPYQHPEKTIPLFATRLLRDQQVTLHGQGQHVRNWLHVEDNCQGIELVLRDGVPGEIYNIGGGTDFTNKELTSHLLRLCGAGWDSVVYVSDRRSNDIRYSMTWDKITGLGYRPERDIEEGLAETIDWYRRNPDRWAPLVRNPHAARARTRGGGSSCPLISPSRAGFW